MIDTYISKLNKDQILPVTDTEGAVLVIAGAGSGKTRVLTTRIAYLVEKCGISPRNILAITFTNKAADEMKMRLEKMINGVEEMWCCTIHSMCVKILRSNIKRLGFTEAFTIYGEDEKERVLKRIITEMELENDKYLKSAKTHISIAKNLDMSPREYKEENIKISNIGIFVEIYAKYQQVLKSNNALDFDDLLIYTNHLLDEDDEVREYYASRFKYVHIDEFQDTNTVQYAICKKLASYWGNIFVVGDDDQSIYGWRGAQISNILQFDKSFKGAKVYKLEQNYRSTKKILNLANKVIKDNTLRKNKTLWTDNIDGETPQFYQGQEEINEAEFVARTINSKLSQGREYKDFAVLMRLNALSRSFEQEFLKYNIRYKVFGGFKFFDRKEIKDVVAYLRIVTNPLDDEAILRIINVPRRGIGEKTVNTIYEKAQSEELSLFDEIFDYENLPITPSAKTRISAFKDTIYDIIIKSQSLTLGEFVKYVIERSGILSQYQEDTEENYDKKLNLNELINSAEEFAKLNENATLTDYLSSITLSSDTDELNDGNFVTIATIHAVKGLEFKEVFVVGLDDGILPIQRSNDNYEELEEERRLLYVAITRARENLYLTRAKSRYLYGSRSYTVESRFIKDVKSFLQDKSPYSSYKGYDNGYKPVRPSYSDSGYYPDEPSSTPYSSGKVNFSSNFKNNNVTPKKQTTTSKFTTGMIVSHPKFGIGTVIAVKEGSTGQSVDVAFKNVGIKSLATAYAPLTIIK